MLHDAYMSERSGVDNVCSTADCAVPGRVCSTAACAYSGRVCSQQPVPSMGVSGYSSLCTVCSPWTCLVYSSLCSLWTCLL